MHDRKFKYFRKFASIGGQEREEREVWNKINDDLTKKKIENKFKQGFKNQYGKKLFYDRMSSCITQGKKKNKNPLSNNMCRNYGKVDKVVFLAGMKSVEDHVMSIPRKSTCVGVHQACALVHYRMIFTLLILTRAQLLLVPMVALLEDSYQQQKVNPWLLLTVWMLTNELEQCTSPVVVQNIRGGK